MNVNDICKALYALPEGGVVPRRRPMTTPLFMALIGIVLLTIDIVAVADKSGALSMSLIVVGVALACYGFIATIVRMNSKERVPYHLPSRGYMRRRERYYNHEQLPTLESALAHGDRGALDAQPTGNVAAVMLVSYHANDDMLDAYALYEYINFEYRLRGEVTIVKKD